MAPSEAATQLCTCVYDCNVPLLRRYIKAGILVNAGNFDSRAALHVAAAEGNVAAVCLLRPLDTFNPFLKEETGEEETSIASLPRQPCGNLVKRAESPTYGLC
jgi:hypothetical protein